MSTRIKLSYILLITKSALVIKKNALSVAQ